MDHAGDVAELELGEHPVEYLEGLVDLLRIVGRRGQALQQKSNTMLKTSDFFLIQTKKFVSWIELNQKEDLEGLKDKSNTMCCKRHTVFWGTVVRNYYLRFRFRFGLLTSYDFQFGLMTGYGSGPAPVPVPYLDHKKHVKKMCMLFYKETLDKIHQIYCKLRMKKMLNGGNQYTILYCVCLWGFLWFHFITVPVPQNCVKPVIFSDPDKKNLCLELHQKEDLADP